MSNVILSKFPDKCQRCLWQNREGRTATEEVILHLLRTKGMPILLYGLEACPVEKSDLDSLDFAVNRFFMKLFRLNVYWLADSVAESYK